MSEQRHGLATILADMKRIRITICEEHGHSPIVALSNGVDPYHLYYWVKYRPSDHIKMFVARVIRGKKDATFDDWNALVDVLIGRHLGQSPGGHAVRRSCRIEERGPILAWSIDRVGKPISPMSEEYAKYLSFDSPKVEARKKALADAVEAVAQETKRTPHPYCDITSVELCDVCGGRIGVVVTETRRRTDAFYNYGWRACKDKRCRAVAVFFKKRFGSRKNPRNPLSTIIEEVARHAGNNEDFRRLAKHFVYHA